MQDIHKKCCVNQENKQFRKLNIITIFQFFCFSVRPVLLFPADDVHGGGFERINNIRPESNAQIFEWKYCNVSDQRETAIKNQFIKKSLADNFGYSGFENIARADFALWLAGYGDILRP